MTDLKNLKGRKVLVTGHTGFKGSWLSLWLLQVGAIPVGYALDPRTDRDNYILTGLGEHMNDYRADIRDAEKLSDVFARENPEIVFHLAAQPLVIEGYQNPAGTFDTNIMGTVNILEAFRKSASATTLVVITTDKVYENREWMWGYRETDRLGGADPYSASKSAAEIVASSYHRSFFRSHPDKQMATVRAGNVIGGGDWSDNRIVPDSIKALEKNEPIIIRNPGSVRPWQHVLEPLGGYLVLADSMVSGEQLTEHTWNFGPPETHCVTVMQVVSSLIDHYGSGNFTVCELDQPLKETGMLMLDSARAKKLLGWRPVLSFDESIKLTVDWYSGYRSRPALDICQSQISHYTNRWKSGN